MKVVIFEVVKDLFLPMPIATWAKEGDELVVVESCEKIVTGWAGNSIVLKERTEQMIKQAVLHIKAKNIQESEVKEFTDGIIEQPLKEKVVNRSMTGRKKKVKTK